MKFFAYVTILARVAIALSVVFALFPLHPVSAFAVSYLDPTYGPPQGFVSFDGSVSDSAIQSDDRVLLLKDGRVMRLLTDGSLDLSFGTDGVADPVFRSGAHLAVSPDEGIIVADTCLESPNFGGENSVLLTRLLSNGTVDPDFHSACIPIHATNPFFSINHVLVQQDGRILVMSFSMIVGDGFFGYSILSRYEADGDLDITFANNGIFIPSENLSDMIQQPDGKILLSATIVSSPYMFPITSVVVRLMTNGQYDPTFGVNGVFTYDQVEANGAYSIVLQSSGRILLGGQETGPGGWTGFVLGLTSAGELDSKFGSNGKVSLPERVSGLILLLDDGFLVDGTGSSKIMIRRYTAIGEPMLNFGDNGIVPLNDYGYLYAFHRQLNGQVLFRGQATSPEQVYVARLDIYLVPHSFFADIAYTHWARPWVDRIYGTGITAGCGVNPLTFCPDSPVSRSQMAVFLLRGKYGSYYVPPSATGSVFGDVPSNYWAAAWIEQLGAEGITGGCGNGNYCPEDLVTRVQMAIFLLSAEHGPGYAPPPAIGMFNDVPADHWAAPWIEQLAAEGITGGCGNGNYCPNLPVTRAQMAVFLVKTFNLP